jgi:hypothetical protein
MRITAKPITRGMAAKNKLSAAVREVMIAAPQSVMVVPVILSIPFHLSI